MRTALAAVMLLGVAAPAACQRVRPSQRQEIMQVVGETEIRVRYIRPVARGRALFGALIPYRETWTPSADSALRIAFSKDVKVQGQALPAGAYSLWTIPDSTQWTIIFNKRADLFHLRSYVEADNVLRLTAKIDSLPHVETLTLSFPSVDGKKAVLRLQWGTVSVALDLETP